MSSTLTPTPVSAPLGNRLAAIAVTTLFGVNGMLLGGYGGVLPSLRLRLDLDATQIASTLFAGGLVGIVSMQVGGRLADSLGAKPVALFSLPILIAAVLVIAAAIIAQGMTTIGGAITGGRDVATTTANFFSFFTVLSNVASVIVLAWAVVWFLLNREASRESRPLATALACVTTYMIVTGIVYNVLLRSIALPQGTTVAWSNEVLHLIGPLLFLADVFLAPRRRALSWRTIGIIVAFPIVWIVYTLLRGISVSVYSDCSGEQQVPDCFLRQFPSQYLMTNVKRL
jgi:MFS family permease